MTDPGVSEPNPSFEDVLSSASGSLSQCEDTDMPLLCILSKHIITLSPAPDAVEQALKDIEGLAAKRGG